MTIALEITKKLGAKRKTNQMGCGISLCDSSNHLEVEAGKSLTL